MKQAELKASKARALRRLMVGITAVLFFGASVAAYFAWKAEQSYWKAEQSFRRAEEAVKETENSYVIGMENLPQVGRLLLEARKYNAAEAVFEGFVKLAEKRYSQDKYPSGHIDLKYGYEDLGRVKRILEKEEAAISLFHKSRLISTEPVKILTFKIQHFAKVNERDKRDAGFVGEQSFTVNMGDQATIFAEFSSPAYSYLLAFRQDNMIELICPGDENESPQLDLTVSYPTRKKPDKRWGFTEGSGSIAFAVIASDTPLPPFRIWSEKINFDWRPHRCEKNTVYKHDGYWIETFSSSSKKNEGKGGRQFRIWK